MSIVFFIFIITNSFIEVFHNTMPKIFMTYDSVLYKLKLLGIKTKNVISQIIELRNICNVNNLTYINNLVTSQVAFRKSQTVETNVYVLYVWLRICELIAEKSNLVNEYNENELKANIENIKKCMFLEINKSIEELKRIFAGCGITFQVVKNFAGAPVQGFIKKIDNKIILSMTIRRSFADEFWFTLFHEIGHFIVVGRIQKERNDFKFCYRLKTRYKWE